VDLLLEALDSRIKEWSFHPGVREWRREKCAEFLRRRFSEMMIYYSFRSRVVNRFQLVFGILDTELYNVVVNVLPQFIGSSVEVTYEVIQELMVSLMSVEAEGILHWLLEQLSNKIPNDCADGLWREELRPPKQSVDIVPKFIWRLFGHPDKRLRWRAAHAVRRAVRQGQYQIIDSLVSICDDKCCATLTDHNHDFFWLSARLWTFILLERLAGEAPNAIKHHSRIIMQEALVPDGLLRHFAQSTALTLNKYEPGIYSTSGGSCTISY
jgi:hypothetical protein